jgi:hypothetical protein
MEFSGFTLTLLQLKNQPAEDFRLTRFALGIKDWRCPVLDHIAFKFIALKTQ